MELIDNGVNTGLLTIEKAYKFWYLGAVLRTKNDWSREIGLKIITRARL